MPWPRLAGSCAMICEAAVGKLEYDAVSYECPHCGERLDGVTSQEELMGRSPVEPSDGDISICAYCGTLLRFSPHGFRFAEPEALILVEEGNQICAQYERIKRVSLIDREFSIATGELTPTMKVKRRVVEEKFKDVIDAMYTS